MGFWSVNGFSCGFSPPTVEFLDQADLAREDSATSRQMGSLELEPWEHSLHSRAFPVQNFALLQDSVLVGPSTTLPHASSA